ncbi:MAG: acyl-CoA thioesterase [Deltaproteobacteria bacterium]|nr:acyl-CoA thioesterase [Deltaproteobacteria bacterium]
MTYSSDIDVRFGDEDHAGIVYYPRFFDFFHRAFEDFFKDHGVPYKDVLDVDNCGWPSVHAEADFASPARFGDVLSIELTVERVGSKSVTFLFRGINRKEDRLVLTGKVTCVCVFMDNFASRPIPDKYRAMFEQHLVAE